MAKAATDEQSDLRRRARRRLIGAMALVTLIAVVLPWVLEREPRQRDQDVSIQIPSPDSSAFKSPVAAGRPAETAAGEKPAASASPASEPKAAEPNAAGAKPVEPAPQVDPLKSEQDKVLAAPQPKSAPPKAAAKEPAPKPPVQEAKKKPETAADGKQDAKQFVLQVTALADSEKALAIQKELAGKGLKAYTEVVKTASGEVTRVRIGPFPGREAAEKEKARLKGMGFDGNVVPR